MRIELRIVMVPMMMIDLSSYACTFIAWMEWLG
jgi:hypothetical protein